MLILMARTFDAVLTLLLIILRSLVILADDLLYSREVRFLFRLSMKVLMLGAAIGLSIKFLEYLYLLSTNQLEKAAEIQNSFTEKTNAHIENVKKYIPKTMRRLLLGVAMGLALITFNVALLFAIDSLAPGILSIAMSTPFGASLAMNFESTVLYAPIFEEIVFRYMLIESIKKVGSALYSAGAYITSSFENISGYQTTWFKPKVEIAVVSANEQTPEPTPEVNYTAVGMSALLFSAAHTGGIGQNIATFFGGLALGRLYEQQEGDLTAPIAAHMANNATVYTVANLTARIALRV